MTKKIYKNPLYQAKQYIIILLSFYVVIEFFAALVFEYSLQTEIILEIIDFIICCIFISDIIYEAWLFNYGLALYARKHILDIIASLPFVAVLRVLRIFRLVRLVRVLNLLKMFRGFKGISPIINFATQNRLRSMLTAYVLITIMIMLFCSAGFYMFEKSINPNVTSYFDALWWAFMTASTVGDALIYPTTMEGRIFAIILIISGVGLFSLITADISSTFVTFFIDKEKQPKRKNK
ncbi:MAG: potassium channel family protein [Patescibacteria group bacterium]